VEEWSVDLRQDTLPGKSAWAIAGLITRGVGPAIALLVALFAGMLITGQVYLESPVLLVLAILSAVSGSYIVFTGIWLGFKRAEEKRAGYTTLANEFPHLPQIDPRTKRVVRLAGEPLLSREQYQERIRLINEAVAAEEEGDSAR
jgi:hypothetical protein